MMVHDHVRKNPARRTGMRDHRFNTLHPARSAMIDKIIPS
jgi:hypothetical protein